MVAPRIDEVRTPVEPVRSEPTTSPTTTYQVVEGDTLAKIAARLSRQVGRLVTVEELCRLNPQFDYAKVGGTYESARRGQSGWDPDHIRTGERLVVPAAPAPAGATGGEPPAGAPSERGETDQVETTPRPTTPEQMAPERTSPEIGIAPGQHTAPRTDAAPPETGDAPATEEPAAEPPRTTPGATAPATEAEQPSTLNKIFATLRKIFQNPIFQGALAVLSAIPGIGTIASAVGFCTGLLSSIGAMIEDPSKPPWMTLASTLLYGVGAFVPGVGAFGGLIGMMTGSEHERAGQARRRPANEPVEQSAAPPRSEPLAPEEYAARLQRVRQNPTAIEDQTAFQEWFAAADDLRQERQLVAQRLADQSQELDAEQRQGLEARRAELDALFTRQLPEQLAAHVGGVAFELSDLTVGATPTAGRLYRVGQGETLDSIAAQISGLAPPPADLAAALRSFNGLDAGTGLPAGTVIYLPSAEQLARRPEAGWPAHWPMARRVDGAHRERLATMLGLFEREQGPAAQAARDLFAIFRRMPVTPVEQPVHATVDEGLDATGAPEV